MSDLLVALTGAIAGAIAAFPFARIQSTRQKLYEKRTEIITEVRRQVLAIQSQLWTPPVRSELEGKQDNLDVVFGLVENKRKELFIYYSTYSIWLENHTKV